MYNKTDALMDTNVLPINYNNVNEEYLYSISLQNI